jgi:DNA-binding transcriptional LysR family regulator
MDSGMELRHLRYFVAVAETLSFTAAARRLNISQPPLSKQIRDLEAELGTPLFLRTSRRVELTTAGVGFLEHARSVLSQTEHAVEDARAIGSGRVGMIRIGTTGSVLIGPLAGLVAEFTRRHPGILPRLYEMGPREQVRATETRRVDVAFLRHPPVDTGLVVETAWTEEVGLCLPVGHPLAESPMVPLAALEGHGLIFLRLRDSLFSQHLRDRCHAAGFAPRILHEVIESYSQTGLVAAGLGLALVPECVRALGRSDVVYRPLAPPAPRADVSMLYQPEHAPALRPLLDLARSFLPGAARAPGLPPGHGPA